MRSLVAAFVSTVAIVSTGFHQASFAGRPVRTLINKTNHPAREGYLLVRRQKSLGIAEVNSVHLKAQTEVVKRYKYIPGLELVKTKPGISSESALKVYQDDAKVLYAEPDYRLYATDLPNDAKFAQQWGLNNVGQTGGTNDADVNAPQAWDTQLGDKSIVLATIDTGMDYNHPDLQNNAWVNPGEIAGNGLDDDHNGYVDDIHGINAITGKGDPMDDNEHGTHVAGIIGAEGNNGLGVSGVMQKASVLSCKFLDADGGGDTSSAIDCLNYLVALKTRSENPVNIVASNNSWAGGPFSQALYDAIKLNRDAGILFMAAASNEGDNNDTVDTYPANFDLTNIISVAATDHSDQLADFSNYGRYSVHVAAPGVDILSSIPGGAYEEFSGTSMATPFVTGLAGLIKSAHPDMNWIQIKNLIISSGKPTNAAKGNTISGRRVRLWDSNGQGALTCLDQKVVSRTSPKKTTVDLKLGRTLPLTLLNINCESSNVAASVQVASGQTKLAPISLSDNGADGDTFADDAVFSGSFKPTKIGTYQLKFPTKETITVRVKK